MLISIMVNCRFPAAPGTQARRDVSLQGGRFFLETGLLSLGVKNGDKLCGWTWLIVMVIKPELWLEYG